MTKKKKPQPYLPTPEEIAAQMAEIRAANQGKGLRNREPGVIPVEIAVVSTWQKPTPRHRAYLPDYQL